jgi:hypothetical protein
MKVVQQLIAEPTSLMKECRMSVSMTRIAPALRKAMTHRLWIAAIVCVAGIGSRADASVRWEPNPISGDLALVGQGPAPVNLGMASNFVILAKSGITNVPTSAIYGNLGVSPIAATAITGFGLILPAGGVYSTCSQVTGRVYAASYGGTTATALTSAILDMQAAYVDAAGRPDPDYTELFTGAIGGATLRPGLYKWGTTVTIGGNVTLQGGPNDVWIFQISGNLTQASATKVILTGGAQAKNVFWQVAGVVAVGTTAHLEGEVLSATAITLNTGATANGRLLAQTNVTLIMNRVVQQ